MDKIVIEHLSVRYSDGTESLRDISLAIPANASHGAVWPGRRGQIDPAAGAQPPERPGRCGRACPGEVLINGQNILDPDTDVIALRRKVGMVFSRPVPLPLTIYQNVSYGLELAGERSKVVLDEAVESALEPGRAVGRGLRPAERSRPSRSPAGSSSACAWRARWRWSRR